MNGTVSGCSEDSERPTIQYNAICDSQLQNNSHLFIYEPVTPVLLVYSSVFPNILNSGDISVFYVRYNLSWLAPLPTGFAVSYFIETKSGNNHTPRSSFLPGKTFEVCRWLLASIFKNKWNVYLHFLSDVVFTYRNICLGSLVILQALNIPLQVNLHG